jgi:glycosyltransferase involved in cell wall biosynthesis
MSVPGRPRALLIGVGRSELPWWWKHVDHDSLGCQLDYWTIPLEGGRPKSPFSRAFVSLVVQTARTLWRARRLGYRYVFTFENDWLTFIIAGLQTALLSRRPRHVILQFIMREKTADLRSRLKYAFMRWCFRSVYRSVCSSRSEAEYYGRVFGWPPERLAFVPFHTDPAFLDRASAPEEPFVLSAGRTFRDYDTLLAAFASSTVPLTIVAGRSSIDQASVPPGVTVLHDIPLPELIGLMARSMVVILPLQDRQISVGQSVLLEAMAMAKPVIVTSVSGTVDYIDHMETGIFVPPADPQAIRDAVRMLADDPGLRRRLGEAGRERLLRSYLPDHYAQGVSRALAQAR